MHVQRSLKLSGVAKNNREERERRDYQDRCSQRLASLERSYGQQLDAMDGVDLRRLFDEAFGGLAEFEWALRIRRGHVVKPQRAMLLSALEDASPGPTGR
jgi:hypothetical protein